LIEAAIAQKKKRALHAALLDSIRVVSLGKGSFAESETS
jgi:hypothetical protein